MDEESARARLRAQGDGASRRARADRVIDSSGTLDDVRRQVEELVAEIRRRRQGDLQDG
jgi:dephospho-CoA kinase